MPFRVSIYGKIDSRVSFNDFYWDSDIADVDHASNVHVRYADVRVSIKPNEHVEGFILVRHEHKFVHSKSKKLHMDEGWVKLDYSGYFMRVGRLDMSFAPIETYAVEKSFTWWMADLVKTGIQFGYHNDYLSVSGAAFNGWFDTANEKGKLDDDQIDDYTFKLGVTPFVGNDELDLLVGAGYVSDIADTEIGFGEDFVKQVEYHHPIPAYSCFLLADMDIGYGSIGFIGEYVESNRFSRNAYTSLKGNKTNISASNFELAYFGEKKWWAGAKYQDYYGFDWLGSQTMTNDPSLKPTRFGSYGLFGGVPLDEYTSLALQVMDGRDDEGNRLVETYFQVLLKY